MIDEPPTEPTPTEQIRPRPKAPEKQLAPPFWEMLPKTIPHTRARTSTVILSVLFIALLWWYLTLYDEFVPKDVQQGRAPATQTSVAPRNTEPQFPIQTRVPTSSAAPSSEETSGSGRPSATGVPSSTVPGAPGQSGTPSTTTTVNGIPLPGGGVLPLPGGTAPNPTSGGAPTTAGPPS